MKGKVTKNVGKYEERKCVICGNVYYIKTKGQTKQMNMKNTRPRTSKTCKKECSKIYYQTRGHRK